MVYNVIGTTLAVALIAASPIAASPTPSLLETIEKIKAKTHAYVGFASCPIPSLSPRSCLNGQSPQGVDGCCNNVPGGFFLSTQFWDANPPTGPNQSWTLHGLWPDKCDSTFDAFCDPSRDYPDIRGKLERYGPPSLVPFMDTYWKDYQGDDESFWEHEWSKHGTCISTLNTTCYGPTYSPFEEMVDYFIAATDTFKTLPTYDWLSKAGISPSITKAYTLAQLQAVAKANFGYEAIWNCQNGELNEVWYGYVSQGPIKGGRLIPTSPDGAKSTCPSSGIKYLPKGLSSTVGGSASGSPGNSSKIFLEVDANGSTNGCLISSGKWYTSGTCAGYSIVVDNKSSSGEFSMSTSKGPCSIKSGELSCAPGNVAAVFSKDSDNHLTYASSSDFFASQTASGQTQVTVSTLAEAVPIKLVYSPQ